MGGAPTPVTYNVARMMPPPDFTANREALKASTLLGGKALDLHAKNLALAAKSPPMRLEYNPSQVSQQAFEFGLQNLQRSRQGEEWTDPTAAKMRLGMSKQIEEATSPKAFASFMERFARERGIANISRSGLSPDSTIARSAMFDDISQAGRQRMLEDINLRQSFLQGNPAPMGGLDPGALVSSQEAVKAQNLGMANAWQAQQMQNAFGLGQSYSDWTNKMMGETLSAFQAEQQSLNDYRQMLINSIIDQANSQNAMAGANAQGNQQLFGTLAGAGIGAVGLAAAAMI